MKKYRPYLYSAFLAIALFAAFTLGIVFAPHAQSNVHAARYAQSIASDPVAAYEQTLIDLYRNTAPSVVSLRVSQEFTHPDVGQFGGTPFPRGFSSQGEGTGFVWDNKGYIVTNNHVVEGATKIEVFFTDGSVVEATVVGQDPDSDLAVLKVDVPAAKLQPIPPGDSDSLQVGQLTIAIGNPFGQESSMTSGIVSAVGRTIQGGHTRFSIPKVIQTDAAINPGNSGGPLLNRKGEVIGINTQILSRGGSNAGIGFAIPINIAQKVVPVLLTGNSYEYAWLGISGRTLDSAIATMKNLPADTKGALVMAVAKDSPADKAGLQGGAEKATMGDALPTGGDVITAINGQALNDMEDLITYLVTNTRPGDKAELAVLHADGKQETLTVILGSRPQDTGQPLPK